MVYLVHKGYFNLLSSTFTTPPSTKQFPSHRKTITFKDLLKRVSIYQFTSFFGFVGLFIETGMKIILIHLQENNLNETRGTSVPDTWEQVTK